MIRRWHVLWVSIAISTSCRSSREPGAIGRHFEGSVWMGALERQTEDPAQWGSAAAFAVLAPAVAFFDHELSPGTGNNGFIGDTHSGDVVSLALGGGALVYGGVNWARGDQGAAFEVAAEGLLVTGAVTQALKSITHRDRPRGSASHASFPSGHTSFAFAGATFLAREIESQTGSLHGYWLFLPAMYVGLNRVEGERHWSSDVAAGAAIGVFLTNWIYNAHFPGEKKSRTTIFETRRTFAWAFAPTWIDDHFALGLSLAF